MMPNWCGNNLIITGPQEELDRFKASVMGEELVPGLIIDGVEQRKATVIKRPFDFNRVLPMPVDPKEQLAQTHGTWPEMMDENIRKAMGVKLRPAKEQLRDAWYNWHVAFWGTKWNLGDDTQVTEEPGKLNYFFDTAWSPPEGVIVAAAAQHPKLAFVHQYWELGCDFAGQAEYRDGKCVEHRQGVPSQFEFVPVPEPEYILCSICGKDCLEATAHRHQDKWIGDECCWDERLRASE